MITSSDGSMELIITEPFFLPSVLKSHHYYHHESSGYASKEPECYSAEKKSNEVKLRAHPRKPIDLHSEQYTLASSPIPIIVSNTSSLTIDEPFSVAIAERANHHLSPSGIGQSEHFPLAIPPDHHRHSVKSPSYQATLFARRHFHIYDWTRVSFYDNVPAPFGYLSEPSIAEDRSPTSASSTDGKRSSTDRQDSGLGASSVERQIDSVALTNNHHCSLTSSSSSSTSSLNSNLTHASSRAPASRKIRVKWHSFTKTHRPSFNSIKYHLGQMSVGQLLALRRAALTRLEELFDASRILASNKPTFVDRTVAARQRLVVTAFSAVPKLIIRRHQQRKQDAQQETKKSVFGVSLLAMTQRTGHPVPSTILAAMKYLRRTSIDSVGIFRKPGVSHRIKRLHDLIETDLEFHHFDEFSPYDVSDVLKQYFRLLPECLFTAKLSPLFLHISDHFASTDKTSSKLNNEQRLLALQYAILLLPDENRLVLHLLLSFLSDVSKHAKTNQMSAINLATCFTPTLFYFATQSKPTANGMPDLKEIDEQRKGMSILAFMIDHVRTLFVVPAELHQACHFSYIEIGEPCTLEELSRRVSEAPVTSPIANKSRRYSSSKHTAQQRAKEIGRILASDTVGSSSCDNILGSLNHHSNNNNHYGSKAVKTKPSASYQGFIDRCIVEVMREACTTKSKGWTSFGKNNEIELAFKKLDDGHPLGLWKCSVEIEAPPTEILNRLLNERHLWDDDFQSGTIIEQLNRNTHVYQYTINSMAPLASRYFCEVRSWRTNMQWNSNGTYQNNVLSANLPAGSPLSASSSAIASFISTQTNQHKETCVLVCTSIEHPKAHCPPTLVRAVTLASRYLIQSYGCGKSRVIHLSRVDLMGRSHEWYTKAYGSMLTRSMLKLRGSFVHTNTGPETKV